MTAATGPRRVDVAGAYDLGVDAYVSLWSPVILPPAQSRARLLATVRARLDALDLDDFVWWGEVVCAVASRPG